MVNLILICAIILGLIAYLIYKLRNPHNVPKKEAVIDYERFTVHQMIEFIKNCLNEATSSDLYDVALDQEDFNRRQNKRVELKSALKNCTSGNLYDKIYIKEFIFDKLLKDYGLSNETIDLVIPFREADKLSPQDKFEILLHIYKKSYGYKALGALIKKYNLDRLKQLIEDGETQSYIITEEELSNIYRDEITSSLSFEEKLHIITQRVYQEYLGLGVIDEIRDMEIDGVSGGVSGPTKQTGDIEDELRFYNTLPRGKQELNSVWIMFGGKTIHLSFLAFKSELELKRVCQNIYKYNNPGPLNETNGAIVNEMWDGSRIVVFRPPFAESWAFWNRKFDTTYTSVEKWFQPADAPYEVQNSELAIGMLKHLMKGARVTSFTGDQGTGKTTLMMAVVKFIYGYMTLRVLEMAFELHLRNRYPGRNIETVRETETVSGQNAMDRLKKTDGMVNIVGEVATPEQASWVIQNANVASKFTIFSHHAKNTSQLLYSMRNSTMQTRLFTDEKAAMDQIVTSIHFDVHLTKDSSGFRYLEHITEIIPVTEQPPKKFKEAAIEFFKRMTNPVKFEEKVIIAMENGRYVAKERPSETQIQEMRRAMEPADRAEFDAFIEKHWGVNQCGS